MLLVSLKTVLLILALQYVVNFEKVKAWHRIIEGYRLQVCSFILRRTQGKQHTDTCYVVSKLSPLMYISDCSVVLHHAEGVMVLYVHVCW